MPEGTIKNPSDIRQDPFVVGLLERLPAEMRQNFTDDQLLGLKVALGARTWRRHSFDRRGDLRLWRWRYYYVFLGGRERRALSRAEERIARMATVLFLFSFVGISALLGLLIVYLAKSALGIDLFPGFSLGIWDWFNVHFP